MVYNIIITEKAKSDTQTAYFHYENIRPGLGEEFLSELAEKYKRLSDKPHHYGFIDDQAIIRDIKVDRFPYVIVFEIIEERVIVYAVHCTYRHPKGRLSD